MKLYFPRALLAAAALSFTATLNAKFAVPPMSSPIVDKAGLIAAADENQLNDGLIKLYKDTEIQIAVLTIDTTDGLPIEQASIKVVDEWKLGKATSDKGVLLLVAIGDRSVRSEVGQGLEGTLTDAYSKRIIDQVIIPLFRNGDSSAGIIAGISGIIGYVAPEVDPVTYVGGQAKWTSKNKVSSRSNPLSPGLFFLFLFLFFKVITAILSRSGARAFRHSGRSSGWSSGGSGWSSGSGSSWSGGGGGFSGGGASGKW